MGRRRRSHGGLAAGDPFLRVFVMACLWRKRKRTEVIVPGSFPIDLWEFGPFLCCISFQLPCASRSRRALGTRSLILFCRIRKHHQTVSKKVQFQGAQISRSEAYLRYAAATSRCSATQKLGFLRNRQKKPPAPRGLRAALRFSQPAGPVELAALRQPQGLFRRLLRCSARDDGSQTAPELNGTNRV